MTEWPRSSLSRYGVRFLFPTNRRAPFKPFARLNSYARKRLGDPLALWRPHDIPHTFAGGGARRGSLVHVIEKALDHTSGKFGGIAGVYQRRDYADERCLAMELWGRHVMGLLPTPGMGVVYMQATGR